jgi:hypothetical protein
VAVEFVCADPQATVRAANVRATLDAFRLVPTMGRRIVEKHKLSPAELLPDNFVLVQRWLDALRDIQAEVGPAVVREVGSRIIENADFPPHFATVENVLEALDTIYHLNHRGDVGHYRTSRSTDGGIVVRCETPYPRQFERGLVEGICRHKVAKGQRYGILYEDGPAGSDVTCVLTVRLR